MIDVTTIGIGVSTDKLRQGTKELDNFGKGANNAANKADNLNGVLNKSVKEVNAVSNVFRNLAVVLGAGGLAKSLVGFADNYTKLTAQIKNATTSQTEYNAAFADVQRIAKTAQADLTAVSALYARLNLALKDSGASLKEVGRITESVALTLKAAGASAGETSSVMLQLSQAFGAGALRSEEFNAVAENAPSILRAVATAMGVQVGQLKAMAAEGAITNDVLRQVLGSDQYLESVRNQAREMQTVSGAWTNLLNDITLAVGQADNVTDASRNIANGIGLISTAIVDLINFMRDNRETIGILLEIYGVAKGASAGAALGSRVGQPVAGGILGGGAALLGIEKMKDAIGSVNRELTRTEELTSKISRSQNMVGNLLSSPLRRNETLDSRNAKVQEYVRNITQYQIELNNLSADIPRVTSSPKIDADDAKKLADKLAREKEQRLNAYVSTQNEFRELTEKYNKISYGIETKIIDESREAKLKSDKEILEIRQKQANDNFNEAQKKAKEEADKYNRIFERANDNLSRSLTDSIVRGFERGEKFIDNFKNAITNAFRGYFVNIGVNFAQEALSGTIGRIGKSVLGAIGLGGSSMAVAGDGVATAGLLDSAKGVFDVITKGFDAANGALQGSVEAFGSFLTNGQGGIFDAIGGAIGQYSSVISGALPYAGAVLSLLQGDVKGAAFSGGGALAGSLIGGPVGGAIGAALGSALGGMFGGKKQPPRTVTQLPQVSEQFNAQLSTLLGGFGLANNVSSSAEYRGRGGGSGYGTLISNVNGSSAHRAIQYKDAYGEATMQQFIQTALTTYLVQSIQQTDLSQAIKNLFTGLTDNAQIQSMIQATIMLKDANEGLSDRFGLTTDTAAQLAKQSGLANEELVNLVVSLSQAAGAFKTPAQQLIEFRDKLTSDLGRALPVTLDAFDAILKSFDTTTSAGRDLFLSMFNLRDEFAQFTGSLDAIKKGVSDSVFGLLSPAQQQAMNKARLSEEFAKFNIAVPQSVQQLIAIGQGLDFTTEAGLNLALAFPSLVQAFQAVNGQVNNLNDSLNNLNPNLYKTSADFRTAGAFASAGMAIPSYAVGTDYVPQDGLAMIHKGERIVTAKENAKGSSDSNVISMLDAKIERLNRAMESVAAQTFSFNKIVKKWDGEGLPTERVV